jgi:hypothetical protein
MPGHPWDPDPKEPAHPAMLLLANADGTLRSDYAEWAGSGDGNTFDLESITLLPVWWPGEHPEENRPQSYIERLNTFRHSLQVSIAMCSPRGIEVKDLASVPPAGLKAVLADTVRQTTPEIVLRALLHLREMYAPALNRARD